MIVLPGAVRVEYLLAEGDVAVGDVDVGLLFVEGGFAVEVVAAGSIVGHWTGLLKL